MHIQGDDKSLTLGAKLDREGCLLVFKRHQKPTTVHAFSDKINFQQNISIVGFLLQDYFSSKSEEIDQIKLRCMYV